MLRRLRLIIVGALVLAASTASAQARVEASINGGYSTSEGITTDDRPLFDLRFNKLDLESGGSLNATFGVLFGRHAAFEFLWGFQGSRLVAKGPFGRDLPVSDVSIYNYMFNYVYNWRTGDRKATPYAFGGLGVTNYAFGELLLIRPSGLTGGEIESKSRFAPNLGAGLKFYFTENAGAKVGFRWTPTYVRNDPEGIWCDPFYGCWEVVDLQYANQFETAVGLTFRFD